MHQSSRRSLTAAGWTLLVALAMSGLPAEASEIITNETATSTNQLPKQISEVADWSAPLDSPAGPRFMHVVSFCQENTARYWGGRHVMSRYEVCAGCRGRTGIHSTDRLGEVRSRAQFGALVPGHARMEQEDPGSRRRLRIRESRSEKAHHRSCRLVDNLICPNCHFACTSSCSAKRRGRCRRLARCPVTACGMRKGLQASRGTSSSPTRIASRSKASSPPSPHPRMGSQTGSSRLVGGGCPTHALAKTVPAHGAAGGSDLQRA